MKLTFNDMTLQEQRAYILFRTYKSKNIVLRIIVQTLIQIIFLTITIVLSVVNDDPSFLLLTFIFGLVFVYSTYLIFYSIPKSFIQKNKLMVNIPRIFEFEDDVFSINRIDPDGLFSESFSFNYSLVKSIDETKNYIIIEIVNREGEIFFAKSILNALQLSELTVFLQKRVGKRYLTYFKVSTRMK